MVNQDKEFAIKDVAGTVMDSRICDVKTQVYPDLYHCVNVSNMSSVCVVL